jgi:hypothetical protein
VTAVARLNASILGQRGWRRTVLPPLVAFLVANIVLSLAAVYHDRGPLDAHTWTSFDSPIYLRIADRGYETWTCAPAEVAQGAKACGTVGWFPLYPALIAPLVGLGMHPEAAGVAVSLVFWLAMLVVLWNGLLLRTRGPAQLPALAVAAFAPGSFYFHTVYPVSMGACLLVIALVALRNQRWLGAGAAGFLATAAYPPTATLAGVAGLWLLFVVPATSWWERVRRIALVSGLTVAGFVAVLLFAQLSVGQWDGYFGVQARFDHGIHLPFANYVDILTPRTEGLGHVSLFLCLQAALTTVLVVTVVATTWLRRRQATPFDWLIVIWALAFWIVPLCQNVVAYYRTDALLVPIVVALVRLPPRLVVVLAAAGAVIAAGMALAFMQGVLV